jgi:hypothetical protein
MRWRFAPMEHENEREVAQVTAQPISALSKAIGRAIEMGAAWLTASRVHRSSSGSEGRTGRGRDGPL